MKTDIPLNKIEIALALAIGTRNHIIIPNVSYGFFGCHECDLLAINKSNYAKEIEIKRSLSDLKADKKKTHNHFNKRISYLYYAIPKELVEKWIEFIPDYAGIYLYYKFNSDYVFDEYRIIINLHRKAKKRAGTNKLTDNEIITLARLQSIRIWSLKQTLLDCK